MHLSSCSPAAWHEVQVELFYVGMQCVGHVFDLPDSTLAGMES